MNKPETIEQAQTVIDLVAVAEDLNKAEYTHSFARGWLEALLFEGLIDKNSHDRLLAEATASVEKIREAVRRSHYLQGAVQISVKDGLDRDPE
jgi:hypothetical protein